MSADSGPLKAKQHRAAILVAEDDLSDTAIAEAAGVSQRTLERWKRQPEFRTAVHEHIAVLATELERYSVARRDKRMAAYQSRWAKLHQLITARGDALADEVAGGDTGLVTKEIEIGKDGTLIENYKTDTGLLTALLNLEKQAAMDAGQWAEKREITGEVAHSGQVVFVLPQKDEPPDPGASPVTE